MTRLPLQSSYYESVGDPNRARKLIRRIRRQRMLETPFGILRHKILRLKAPPSALKEALQIYDPGLPSSPQNEESLDKIAQAYGLRHLGTPSHEDLWSVITERIDRDVERALGRLGYNQFSWFSRDGRLYMEVSTSLEGQEPPSLPSWLQIPYIIPTRGHVLRIIPDSYSSNRKVLPGQALKDTEGRPLGSLGPILASERRGSLTPVHVALTAGHVIPDMATEMMVDDPSDPDKYVRLKVSVKSRREHGKRVERLKYTAPFTDDVGFLIIPPESVNLFDCFPLNINSHMFNTNGHIEKSDMLDPVSYPRFRSIQKRLRLSSILVFKTGMMTDLTMGHLVKVSKSPPEGWWQNESLSSLTSSTSDDSDDGSSSEGEENDWIGYVKWSTIPFAAGGDSGSFVWAVESGVLVPLGVHVGSPESVPDHSCFLALESFCYEGEQEG